MVPPPQPPAADAHPFDALVQVMDSLRSEGGCPWDREQDLQTLKSYCLEECYEVLEAIDGGEPEEHKIELGDLLLQIIFQSQIRKEQQAFDAYDVCRAITDKLLRRHPHVFGEEQLDGAKAALASWEAIKAKERAGAAQPEGRSVLSGVPRSLPGLLRALKLTEKAARVGFDWERPAQVVHKLQEEVDEIEEAVAAGDHAQVAREFGDLLFGMANLARHLQVDPEDALRGASDRFTARFQHIERSLAAEDLRIEERSLADLERRWEVAKVALAEPETGA